MSGRPGTDERIEFLESTINLATNDLVALHHQRDQERTAQRRAMEAFEQARAIESRCSKLIADGVDALRELRAEIASLIPKQREGD